MITLKTNTGEAIQRIKLRLEGLDSRSEDGSRIIRTAALNVVAEMRDRVQLHGQSSDGTEIGKYSTKPMYVSLKANPGKSLGRPLGKLYHGKRRSVFEGGKKKGQDHTSRFFQRGYDEYKSAIGRNTIGKVNLTLTGQMMGLLAVFPTDNGWGIGWADVSFAKRSRFFSKKYGTSIFGASVSERKLALDTAKRLLKDAISR